MIINHNISALHTYRKLAESYQKRIKSMEKLSSGLRINRAGDDAAGLAISEKMRGQIRGLQQAGRNIQDGISLLQTADSGLANIHEQLQRARELAVQAANDTLTSEDRNQIQLEIDQIKHGIDSIANHTEFNEMKPLIAETTAVSKPSNSPDPSGQPVDIVFLVDYSSSMGSIVYTTNPDGTETTSFTTGTNLAAVYNGISDFVTGLNQTAIDAQIGIVNIDPGSPTTQFAPLESDPEIIKSNLLSLYSWYDYTKPYEKLVQSVPTGDVGQNLGYRSDAKKVFVLFTDTGNESGIGNESTAMNAVEGDQVLMGYDQDDIQTYVFGFPHYEDTDGDPGTPDIPVPFDQSGAYDDIVKSTGGNIYITNAPTTPEEVKATLITTLVTDINKNIGTSESEILEERRKILMLQVGPNEGNTFKAELTDARTTALGIDKIKVETRDEAEDAMVQIGKAIDYVSSERARFGACQNALEHIHNNVANYEENLTSAESRIRDADIAKEMMHQAKYSILSQAAQALLAQANQQPESVLQLLR